MTKIVLVGEAWGKDEEIARAPFVGASGRILNSILSQVGIDRKECFVTNVFNLRPSGKFALNDIVNLCGPADEGIPGMPYIRKGKYVRAEFQPELERLYGEIKQEEPNVILAFGATAAWAFLGSSGIRHIRGAPALATFGTPGVKIIPTYHPAAVMREWKLRPIVLADCSKAVREGEYKEIHRPERFVWIEPDLDDLEKFFEDYIINARYLSIDIETVGTMITCFGVAASKGVAIVCPFYDPTAPGKNYWPTRAAERTAWDWVIRVCHHPAPKIFQNGLYDMRFLLMTMNITVVNPEEDTMLLHHALQPEMEKSLGFLGTIYTDEASWKFMRKEKGTTLKKED